MSNKRGLLLVKLDIPEEQESEWNNWYNDVHVPGRLALPGFLSAGRYIKIEGIPKDYATLGEANYLALYDLDNVMVLKDEPYKRVRAEDMAQPSDSFKSRIFKLPKFARGVYEQIYPEQEEYTKPTTKFIFAAGHEVPRNRHREFNTWYNTEHIPALMAVPGFFSVRRFIMADREIPPMVDRGGSLSQYLTIWDIEDERALKSEAFQRAAKSPWSDWVRSWYTRKMCTLYSCIYPKV